MLQQTFYTNPWQDFGKGLQTDDDDGEISTTIWPYGVYTKDRDHRT